MIRKELFLSSTFRTIQIIRVTYLLINIPIICSIERIQILTVINYDIETTVKRNKTIYSFFSLYTEIDLNHDSTSFLSYESIIDPGVQFITLAPI